jgi:DNA-binding transcriptional regulator YiaG
MKERKISKPATKKTTRARKRQTVGESIIEGLKQAVAWTKGENDDVRVTLVHVPQVDVRQVRRKMGLSQAQFATRFGLPPATLRNWEQGRAHHPRAAGGDREAPRGGRGRPAEGELTGL